MATPRHPRAALLAFCAALASYNVLNTVKAALRSAHGHAEVTAEVTGNYVADEVALTQRGMMIAIPEKRPAPLKGPAPGRRITGEVRGGDPKRPPPTRSSPERPRRREDS